MARVNIVAQTTPGAYPTLPISANARDVAFQAADTGLGNETTIVENKTLVLVWNTNGSAQTVTFTSSADAYNRTGDITAYSIGANEVALFGPFKLAGWTQSGKLWIDASHADVKFAVITLP